MKNFVFEQLRTRQLTCAPFNIFSAPRVWVPFLLCLPFVWVVHCNYVEFPPIRQSRFCLCVLFIIFFFHLIGNPFVARDIIISAMAFVNSYIWPVSFVQSCSVFTWYDCNNSAAAHSDVSWSNIFFFLTVFPRTLVPVILALGDERTALSSLNWSSESLVLPLLPVFFWAWSFCFTKFVLKGYSSREVFINICGWVNYWYPQTTCCTNSFF